jgi:serine/threonine-protein kinase HipA
MNICPITYEPCGDKAYSVKGLKLLSQNLDHLEPFAYSAEEQREEAMARAVKLSIQGVQPKLSAIVNIKDRRFDLVDQEGRYILKPQHQTYPQLPENEDLTMRMAEEAGISVPLHGLIWSKDQSLTYFIKRFDRAGHKDKIPVEDFAQLASLSRETKYNYTMERAVVLMDTYCTFPVIEKAKFFRIVLFNYLTGNEDMHMKNYSLITRENKTTLSPAYDLINSTIVLKGGAEEIALSIAGKKKNLKRKDLVDYFGKERCGLPHKIIDNHLLALSQAKDIWFTLIEKSFLSGELKEKYRLLLTARIKTLEI